MKLLVLFLGLDGDKELVSLLLGEAEGGPGVHVLVWLSSLKSSLKMWSESSDTDGDEWEAETETETVVVASLLNPGEFRKEEIS